MRVLVAVALLLVSNIAFAERDPERAAKLFEEGRVLQKDEKWDAACKKFEESYELDNATGTKVNLAECSLHSGKLVRAYELFDQAAREDDVLSVPKRAGFSRQRMATLAKKLVKVTVVVKTTTGVTLEINGETVDDSLEDPIVRMLEPGEVSVIARARGFPKFSKVQTGSAGDELRVSVPAFAAKATTTTSDEPGPRDRTRVRIALALGIGGLLALAGGAISGLSGQAEYDTWTTVIMPGKTEPECTYSDLDLKFHCSIPGAAHLDHAEILVGLANGLAIGGGALIIAGFIVYVTAPREPRASSSTAFVPIIGPDRVGIAFDARF